ncbi:MAG: adenine-specific methyltransferase EcoRI family protein [Gammaproteobacteria bacterium]|nr:adenine-specific methyltransferase EcoRI family protein [Gammaproteobacteria bacterium]
MNNTNRNLIKAKQVNDEYFTTYPDIDNELCHYTDSFRNKVVFCNCDTPGQSQFIQWFQDNQTRLGIKHLYWNYGDFRSESAKYIMGLSDIVVTNPPFSLFSEFLQQIIDQDKKFIVLGSINAVTYKTLFPLLMNDTVWAGVNTRVRWFDVPSDDPKAIRRNGRLMREVATMWYTNLDNPRKHKLITKGARYSDNPELYPRLDNYDAINVSAMKILPLDYDGVMAVPVTFFEHHNPTQFKIVGITYLYGCPDHIHTDKSNYGAVINGKEIFKRIFIQRIQGV